VDLEDSETAQLALTVRALVPQRVKQHIAERVRDELGAIARGRNFARVDVFIDRFRASSAEQDPTGRTSIFGQVFTELGRHARDVSLFMNGISRPRDDERMQWWTNAFHNEQIQDAAGGFRDVVSSLGQDLMSERTPLFVHTTHGSSAWNGYWLPNPLCTNFEQFEFLGRLMAGCILSAERVVINMPAFYWKQLAGVPTTIEEYYAEGCAVGDRGKEYMSEISFLRDNSAASLGIEDLDDVMEIKFDYEVTGHAGHTRPLVAGGASRLVTWDNAADYVRRLQHVRLHECDQQVAAIRRGLLEGVPLQLLRLWTASEFDIAVAGDPNISVEDLKKSTRFQMRAAGGRAKELQAMFWRCVSRMDMEQRALLLKFSAGRLRLPCSLMVIIEGSVASYPTSHTCFCQLCMPPYETEDEMFDKLTGAIVNGMGFDESAV